MSEDWLKDFDTSGLSDASRAALPESVRFVARHLELATATPEEIVRVLTSTLPRRVIAIDPDVVVGGLIAFLIWAVKRGRIREQRVEYAIRKHRTEVDEAMRDDRTWSPSKQIILAAVRDGVDPSDLDGVREHALARGMSPDYVDEFVYPQPICLADGLWLQNEFAAACR